MKTINLKRNFVSLIAAAILGLAPLSASALDILGKSNDNTNDPNGDLACALNPSCALPRGGVSGGILVSFRGTYIYAALAFADEEINNIYFLPPNPFSIDLALADSDDQTFLTDANGEFSDLFGVIDFGTNQVLGFISAPTNIITITAPVPGGIPKTAAASFPLPFVMAPDTVPTILYDATPYISSFWREAGAKVEFFSNIKVVPEPGVLALLGIGLACMHGRLRRRG